VSEVSDWGQPGTQKNEERSQFRAFIRQVSDGGSFEERTQFRVSALF